MPTYDYKCPKCPEVTCEVMAGYKEHPLLYCMKCNSLLAKQISRPLGIHFKGTGFYETDYKDK